MIPVSDIYKECAQEVGTDDQDTVFQRITDAVELLANKGDFDPLFGVLDIRVYNGFVALPREVEIVLSLNAQGVPFVGRDQLFQFHLNGPGQFARRLRWEYADCGDSPVYAQPKPAMAVRGICAFDSDINADMWVYGKDWAGNEIRTQTADGYVDGYKVPVAKSFEADPRAPRFSLITRVRKQITNGPVTLAAGAYALATYQHNDEEGRFRLIKLFYPGVEWVRIAFRRATFKLTSLTDLIPLNNGQAVVMMVRAMKHYKTPENFALAEACEATALRWLSEEQFTRTPPVVSPIQVHEGAPLLGYDYVD